MLQTIIVPEPPSERYLALAGAPTGVHHDILPIYRDIDNIIELLSIVASVPELSLCLRVFLYEAREPFVYEDASDTGTWKCKRHVIAQQSPHAETPRDAA
jgi:hypothetical protein